MIRISKISFYSVFAFLVFGMAFIGTKSAIRSYKRKEMRDLEQQVAKWVEPISEYKKFIILVMSYNNEYFCEENIRSLAMQDYEHYEILYIDDASLDSTQKRVEKAIDTYGLSEKFFYCRNEKNLGAMTNLIQAVHALDNGEIVVIVDGDDQFLHPKVLSNLNHYYQNRDVWMTYGSYVTSSFDVGPFSKNVGYRVLKRGQVRDVDWSFSHLRTFYAGLFKQISIEDFKQNGQFFEVGCDLASMYPMLEMAREHAYFVSSVSYIYNIDNSLSDHIIRGERQQKVAKYLKKQKRYSPLQAHPSSSTLASKPLDEELLSRSKSIKQKFIAKG